MDLKNGDELRKIQDTLPQKAKIITGIRLLLDVQRRFHDVGEIHRDLKPGNVMAFIDTDIPNDVVVSVIDTDSSTELRTTSPTPESVLEKSEYEYGTYQYKANEASDKKYGVATDVYSLAVILNSDLKLSYPVSNTGTTASLDRRPQIWQMVQELWIELNKLDSQIQNQSYMTATKKAVERLIREKNPKHPDYDESLGERTALRAKMIRFASNIGIQESSSDSDTMLKELLALSIKKFLREEAKELENEYSNSPPDLANLIQDFSNSIITTIKMIKARGAKDPDVIFKGLIKQLKSNDARLWQREILKNVQPEIEALTKKPYRYNWTIPATTSIKPTQETAAVMRSPAAPRSLPNAAAPVASNSTATAITKPAYQPKRRIGMKMNAKDKLKLELETAAKAAESSALMLKIHAAYQYAKHDNAEENLGPLVTHAYGHDLAKMQQNERFFNQLASILRQPAHEATEQANQVKKVIELCNTNKNVGATQHFMDAFAQTYDDYKKTEEDNREQWMTKCLNQLSDEAVMEFRDQPKQQRIRYEL